MQIAETPKRSVSWPRQGDATTFRRSALAWGALGSTLVVIGLGAAALVDLMLLRPLAPLAAAALLLLALYAHGAARAAARRAEVRRSFAGMTVVHRGQAFAVADAPLLGEHPTRRHAARAAMDRGGWAAIVHAWDRYYVLACLPADGSSDAVAGRSPVSFRSRAVADIVPAIRDEVA